MTQISPGGPPPPGSLSVSVGARAWGVSRWRTPTARRYLFGYVLLAPAVLYVALLVGVPFVFSLYLAMSDASVGAPVARFIGLENFASALENAVFYTALRNTLVFTVGAGILKGLLGTMLAFLLLQPFKGRKIVRALIVIPFTLPIAVRCWTRFVVWKSIPTEPARICVRSCSGLRERRRPSIRTITGSA